MFSHLAAGGKHTRPGGGWLPVITATEEGEIFNVCIGKSSLRSNSVKTPTWCVALLMVLMVLLLLLLLLLLQRCVI